MFDITRSLRKMGGNSLNIPRVMAGKSVNDWDGDGIPNRRDCQPRNMFRQDSNDWRKLNSYFDGEKTFTSGRVGWNEQGSMGDIWYNEKNDKIIAIGSPNTPLSESTDYTVFIGSDMKKRYDKEYDIDTDSQYNVYAGRYPNKRSAVKRFRTKEEALKYAKYLMENN